MKLKVASNYSKTEKERSMNENIQEDYDEYGDTVENSFSEYFRDKLERTPWWMISIVFHVTLAFLATLVVYSKATPESEPEFEYVTEIQPVKREQVKPERKKDVFETNPVKFDEPIIENPIVNKVDVSDHHETESLEDHQMAKGLEALQNSPVKQNFDNSSIGINRVGYRHRNGQIEFESSVMTTQPVFRLGELFRQGLQGNVVSPALQKAFAENEHSLSNYTTLERKNFRGISSALGSSVASNESSSWLLTDTQNKKQYIIDGSQLMVSLVPAVFAASEAMTAVSMTARIFMKSSRKEPHFEGGADLLRQYLPAWKERDANNQSVINYYYWYYGTLAMFQMGGDYWSDWNEKMKDVLVNHQEKEGCKTGSWPAIGKRCSAGGRIYATTLSILSLEIYYRYQKILNE